MTTKFEKWAPPAPPVTPLDDNVMLIDTRVDQLHRIGQLPCPANPPPPIGWKYWHGREVSAKAAQLAVRMLSTPKDFPMGSFLQTYCEGELIGARVEWHRIQGATGKEGCFRGVNLMLPVVEEA